MKKAAATILEWGPKYSVHLEKIDKEHRVWFALINGVHQALIDGAGKEILRTVLAETTQYTFSHFAHEEELMEEIDYPELAEHVLAHRNLERQARDFTERLENGQSSTVLEFLVFLSEWVKIHTMTVDRNLGNYVQTHGLE